MSTTMQRLRRRLTAVAAVGALTAGVLGVTATSSQAAPVTTKAFGTPVSGATLTWGLNGEQGGGAFFGICNFLSAGTAGNTGTSRPWLETDGFYKTTDGNVTVEKPNTAGEYSQPSWSTKCQTPNGSTASAGSTTSLTGNRVKISSGTGSFDTATGAGSIQWTGSFTSVFYGGMTYWTASNPKLTVNADGTAALTATLSGYGADMNDSTKWEALPTTTATLADFKNVTLDEDGFTATPTYLGTSVTSSTTPQTAKTSANEAIWGSFPQSFVDYQVKTGQSSYWYSSGGSRDAAKPATPFTVSYAASTPQVTVSETTINPNGTTTVDVEGKGFLPSLATGARPPLMNQASGAYVAFGKYAAAWRPSQGAAGATRSNATVASGGQKWAVPAESTATVGGSNAGAIVLSPQGTFSTQLVIDKTTLDKTATASTLVNYGIYTYAGSGATVAAYETYTPIQFKTDATVTTDAASYDATAGTARDVKATVTTDGAPAVGDVKLVYTPTGGEASVLDTKTLDADGQATLQVPANTAAGSGKVKVAYQGNSTTKAADSAEATLTIEKQESTLALDATVYSVFEGSPVTVKPTVTLPGGGAASGQVTLDYYLTSAGASAAQRVDTQTLDANGKATLSLPGADQLAAGSYRVVVAYQGTATVKASSSTNPLLVKAKTASTVSLDKPSYFSTIGTPVDVVATVKSGTTPAAGDVDLVLTPKDGKSTVVDSGTLDEDGTATLQVPADEAVLGTVAVEYKGSSSVKAAASAPSDVEIDPRDPSLELDQLSYTGLAGNTVPVTVTVADGDDPATGDVSLGYYPEDAEPSDAVSIGEATLQGGSASFEVPATLQAGSYRLLAVFKGTSTLKKSSTIAFLTLGEKAAAGVTVTAPSTTFGDAATVTVKVPTDATGSVTLKGAGQEKTADVKNGQAVLTVPNLDAGTYALTASYSGDAAYKAGSGTANLVVAKAASTVTVGAVKTHSYGNVVDLTATVSGAGTVSFTEGSTSYGKATVTSGKAGVTLPARLAVGSHTVKAVYTPSDANHAASETTVKVTVKKVATTTALNVTKKPTTKAGGSVNVRVRQSVGISLPRGTITIKLTRGGVTKTVKKSFTDGYTTIALPKVSSKGAWKVTATFASTTLHEGSSKSTSISVN